jgi:hypothetical protein
MKSPLFKPRLLENAVQRSSSEIVTGLPATGNRQDVSSGSPLHHGPRRAGRLEVVLQCRCDPIHALLAEYVIALNDCGKNCKKVTKLCLYHSRRIASFDSEQIRMDVYPDFKRPSQLN